MENNFVKTFGEFINEAKKKQKKSSGLSKADINKALKDAGFENVNMRVDTYHTKTYKPLTKGLSGGSVGPMTATSAHLGHNADRVKKLEDVLWKVGGERVRSEESSHLPLVWKFPTGKKDLVYKFFWQQYPTHAGNSYDRDYKTFWLVYNVDEIVPVDESIDADTITKSLDSGAPYVHNIEKGYYGITDNIYDLVEWLEAAASEDSDWNDELKIFKEVKKLVDKSKIGKFL